MFGSFLVSNESPRFLPRHILANPSRGEPTWKPYLKMRITGIDRITIVQNPGTDQPSNHTQIWIPELLTPNRIETRKARDSLGLWWFPLVSNTWDAPKLCHSPRRHCSALVWAPAVPVAPWAPCHWTRTTWPAFWATCGTLESVFLMCFNGFLRYHYSMVDLMLICFWKLYNDFLHMFQ